MADDALRTGAARQKSGDRLVEELKESLRQAARGEGLTDTGAIRERVEQMRANR